MPVNIPSHRLISKPSIHSFSVHLQVNSAIVPTKVLSDPMELERTLQSGLLQTAAASNGFAFDPAAAAMAAAAAAAASDAGAFAENVLKVERNHVNCKVQSSFKIHLYFQASQDVAAAAAASALAQPPAQTTTIPPSSIVPEATTVNSPMLHNLPLPLTSTTTLTSSSVPNGPTAQQTIVTAVEGGGICSVTPKPPQVTIVAPQDSVQIAMPPSPTQSSSNTTICEADVHVESLAEEVEDLVEQENNRKQKSSSERRPSKKVRHTQTRDAEEGKENETSFITKQAITTVPSSNNNTTTTQCDNVNELQQSKRTRIKKSSSLKRGSAAAAASAGSNGEAAGRTTVTRKASVPASMVLSEMLPDASGALENKEDEDAISVVTDDKTTAKNPSSSSSQERKRSLRSRKTKTKMVHCADGEVIEPILLPEKEEYKITLVKGEKGLGITVAGYICEKGREE